MEMKRDRDYIRRALKEQNESKTEPRSQSLKWKPDENRFQRKISLPEQKPCHSETLNYLVEQRKKDRVIKKKTIVEEPPARKPLVPRRTL